MALKPMVDGLETEIGEDGRVVRLNVRDKGELARQLDLKLTPSFVMLDKDGNEKWRSVGKPPDKTKVLKLVRDQD